MIHFPFWVSACSLFLAFTLAATYFFGHGKNINFNSTSAADLEQESINFKWTVAHRGPTGTSRSESETRGIAVVPYEESIIPEKTRSFQSLHLIETYFGLVKWTVTTITIVFREI